MRRFINLWERYTNAVAKEAELRERGQIPDLKSFIPLRRDNSAVRLCFSIIEYALGIDLEDEVYEDSTFMDAYWAACDHVCWANVCFFNNIYRLFCSFINTSSKYRTFILTIWSSQKVSSETTSSPF